MPGGSGEPPQRRDAILERAFRVAGARRGGAAHQLSLGAERRHGAAQGRGGPARERGALPGDLRARRRRRRPGRARRTLAPGEPAPVRDRRLRRRRAHRGHLPGHHPPRRPGEGPRPVPGHAAGRAPDLRDGEALREEGRLPRMGEPDGLAGPRRRRAPLLRLGRRGHRRAEEGRGGARPPAGEGEARAGRGGGGAEAAGPASRLGSRARGLARLRGYAATGHAIGRPGPRGLVPARRRGGGRDRPPARRRPRRPGERGASG